MHDWTVIGADRSTGDDRVLAVTALTEEEARSEASRKGLLVESVRKASASNVKVLDYATGRRPALPLTRDETGGIPSKNMSYKVLTQKDKWFSQKFDPSLLEAALNAYASQGWRICAADTASFPGAFTGFRQELIAVLERDEEHAMFEYKVLTQKDKWFSGKFDPQRLEAAINAYAEQGWRVVVATTVSFPGFFSSNREELILVMERRRS